MTAVPLPPIVPLADLVAELRAMHSIPCLTAADRLEEMDREAEHLDALRPLCPTCGGDGCFHEERSHSGGDVAEMITGPCPHCVDGHVTWQRLVNVFNAVHLAVIVPTTQDDACNRLIKHLRAIR